ncbi:hypothetical protein M409DRAFT_68990 [Zasmidium cellare ATCC 36951]|uniref:Ubiquitin-activating enzyme E1-like n=1 Tax=Zasmidium cellare ATCC 36951 TaxID=1080233 RepID=A0A6A6C6I1_ZASCE|nr:uncharacterized protein M409DRAFT_68990 [Zasmidium cellare ATCC 36951]KAF2162724.1 hypothetical protein M409DRAFT_68990 [Zasmidium cellare ATCC 36951]
MPHRERSIAQSLGLPTTKRVKQSRVLVVGAGGIGCELLKTLVCCGFGSGYQPPQGLNGAQQPTVPEPVADKKAEIVVVDLDTIDLSNLNRQFLFRKHHIKKPKAIVAKETASQFNPSVNIDAHHASIYDNQYDVQFYEGFDIVFNALDNLAARRHVNRMCLAANVPLIESGTTGFNGQVQAIKKGETECYDCNEKPVQKSFPICTIRSTPSQPIHCIVWAKSYLLPELFGTSEDDSSDMTITDTDDAEEVAKLKEEAEALKKIRGLMGKSGFAKEVFNKVFTDDIERLREMEDMWQSRKKPEALRFESVSIDADPIKQGQALATQDQEVWSLQDNLKVFTYALDALSNRMQAGESAIEFDKDDKDTLDFVAAAANLRSHVFDIPVSSEWQIKQMAGNIIPAIATSNALTASLCVFQAFKIIRSQTPVRKPSVPAAVYTANSAEANGRTEPPLGGSKMVFLESKKTDRMIASQSLVAPREDCPVCSPFYAKVHIKEGSRPTMQQLVDLLKVRLNYEDFSIAAAEGKLIYDPDLEENLPKALADFGVDGTSIDFLSVQDDSDEPKVDLVLSVKSKPTVEGDDDIALFPDTIILPPKPPKKTEANGDLVDPGDINPVPVLSTSTKRKREGEDDLEENAAKKTKADTEPVYVVEDDGSILLD